MPTDFNVAISINQMRYAYGKKLHDYAMQIDSWRVMRGQKLFLHGPSGSGKTTLLHLISGIIQPTQGKIQLLEQDFSSLSGRKRDRFRAKHIGVVFQKLNLIPYLSVLENIVLAQHFAHRSQKRFHSQDDVKTHAESLLSQLNLPIQLLNKSASELSVGQQQRVAIARALINSPEILVADEPTSALDSDARDAFMELLLSCCEKVHATLLFISHDKGLMPHFNEHVDIRQLNLLQHSPATEGGLA